ncbi:MAG: phenylalanine--tRNA ligase subunit beta [Gemmatimonadota bacterium]
MNVSYNWLKAVAPTIRETPEQLAERLAMLGAPVAEIVAVGDELRDVVIARTRSVQRHPNADRLSLCEVDAGGEILQVVCGAPNVKAGAFYPFAPVGSTLPGDLIIKQAKIRGSESQGMLCSARELQLGRDHEGILELHGEFTPGQSFIEAVGLDDTRIVVDVTPNRGDLLSHWGIARELAPGGQHDLTFPHPEPQPHAFPHPHPGTIAIRVADSTACPRYIAIEIEGVKIGPSPEWLAARLRAIGARPINNVVDATNYVLHELGQPLHAFDRTKLGKQQIIVRRAQSGETLTTLDGEKRKLDASMLVIADGEKATAIAGVMGGLESEVTDETTSILLECALFEPRQVRKTRTALELSTDASYRFERGVDAHLMLKAVGRGVRLILDSAGGKVVGSMDVYPQPIASRTIEVRPARVRQVLGQGFDISAIAQLLEPIGFEVGADGMVTVPGHRLHDVEKEIDLIEEVARRYGYNNFASELLPFRPSSVPEDGLARLEARLREQLVARGFLEARTAAFAPEHEGDVALMHPLSSAESRLRRALLPALYERIEYNLNRGARNIRLFEIGTAFAQGDELPRETTRLAVAFTGLRNPAHWTGGAAEFDIWDLKALVEDLARLLGITNIAPISAPDSGVITEGFAAGNDETEIMGGRLRSDYIDAPAWAGEFFGLEAVLPATSRAAGRVTYAPLAQHPPTEQDIALVVPEALASETIEATIRKAGGIFLEHVAPFDLYRGAGIPAGTRSIAYRLRFRASDRTLTDAEADEGVRKILNLLKDEHGVERRG